MRNRIIILATLLLVPMMILTQQNCTKPKTNASLKSTGILQDAPQPPSVQCQIQSETGKALTAFGTTGKSAATLQPIVSGSNIRVSCSQSTGDISTASELIYSLAKQDGSPFLDASGNPVSFTGFLSTLVNVGNPGKIPLKLTVNDPQNNTSASLNFDIFVQCQGTNTLAYTGSGISVSSAGKPNYFNYQVGASAFSFGVTPPAGITGAPQFSYSVDYNGDGVIDVANPNGSAWSAASSSGTVFNNVYNSYINITNTESRVIHVLAMDNTCFYTAQADIVITSEFNNSQYYVQGDINLVPPLGKYYYIQADTAGLNGLSNPSSNGHILFTKMEAGESVEHVSCSPEKINALGKTAFTVTGTNVYDSRPGGVPQMLSLHFSNLTFPAGSAVAGPLTFSNLINSNDGSALDGLTFGEVLGSSAEGSFQNAFSFQPNLTTCSYKIQVQRLPSGMPCSATDATIMPTMRYYGSYSCNDLHALSPQSDVSALKNGYFFCEANVSDGCIGGNGQAGGGINPIAH